MHNETTRDAFHCDSIPTIPLAPSTMCMNSHTTRTGWYAQRASSAQHAECADFMTQMHLDQGSPYAATRARGKHSATPAHGGGRTCGLQPHAPADVIT